MPIYKIWFETERDDKDDAWERFEEVIEEMITCGEHPENYFFIEKIKNEGIRYDVFYKLWEIFSNENKCKYLSEFNIHKIDDPEDYEEFERTMDNLSNEEQIWTILTKILPKEIHITESSSVLIYKLNISPTLFHRDKIEIDYLCEEKSLRGIYTAEYGNVWESLLWLLDHIIQHVPEDARIFIF
jgi:hypothetical protein